MIEQDIRAADGTRLRTYGVGRGPSILLANGLGGTPDAWRRVIERFQEHYRFVTWDYRGLYGSDRPPADDRFQVDDQVADAVAVLDHHRVETAVVMGWSMGVQVALALALAHPHRVRGLVLINGTSGSPLATVTPWPPVNHVLGCLVRAAIPLASPIGRIVSFVAPNRWFLELGLAAGFADRALDREVFHAVAGRWPELDYDAFLRTLAALGDHDASGDLERIDCPVLVVHGDRDRLTPIRVADHMVARLPRARLFTVPGGSHYSILERPEVVNLQLERFLASLDSAGGAGRALAAPPGMAGR